MLNISRHFPKGFIWTPARFSFSDDLSLFCYVTLSSSLHSVFSLCFVLKQLLNGSLKVKGVPRNWEEPEWISKGEDSNSHQVNKRPPAQKKTGLRRWEKFKGGASSSIVNCLFKNQGQSDLQITLRSLRLQTTINSKRNKKISPLTLGQDVNVLKMC